MPKISREGYLELPADAESLIQALFSECRHVIVKREFTGNRSGSRVFLLHPIAPHGAELPVVVKCAAPALIEKEWRAYQDIHKMLHGVLQVQGEPHARGDWGALCYPLAGGGAFEVATLRDHYAQCPGDDLAGLLARLFKTLGNLHNQSQAIPDFSWRTSYDRLLPLNLLIEAQTPPAHTPVTPLTADNARNQPVPPGDWVRLDGFVVTKVDARKQTVTLDLPPDSKASFNIRLKFPHAPPAYRDREVINGLTGQVLKTRQSQLADGWQELFGPAADPRDETIETASGLRLPNPLHALSATLDRYTPARVAYIHGDLNLHNILVDVETGAVSLIDIAEARRDHVLHDFLRLETEFVTHILPGLLRQHDLEPEPTLHSFYHNLHCATFEREQLTAHQAIPELRKLFEALCTLRRATYRHLYDDKPCEYYQGLLLYLTGALKFANLHDPATQHLPKRAALWAAATVAELLEIASVCQQMALPEPETRPPHAVLVDYRPEVFIRRRSSDQFVQASYGISLYRGDIVGTCDNAEASVQCLPGPHIRIPPERNQRIDCEHPPQDHVLANLEIRQEALLPPLVNEFSMNARLTQPARLRSPRNSRIRHTRPDFRWQAVASARGYRLTLRLPEGRVWQQETAATQLPYPADAPDLPPGSGNTVILEALGTDTPPEATYLEVLDAPGAAAVREREADIRALRRTEATESFLLAQLYREWRLWMAAIRQLERVTRLESAEPIPWLHLGELYLRVGLTSQAELSYSAGLDTLAANDAVLHAVAHLGLTWACATQGRADEAHAHLDAVAASEYAPIAWQLRSRLTATPPVPPAPFQDFATAVQALAAQIATPLAAEIREIPERFHKLLEAVSLRDLQPAAGAWATLDAASERLAAREVLAATHFATRDLLATLSPAEVERQAQSGQLFYTLERHARAIAEERLGLSPDRAADFARRYADLMGHNPALLRALLESEGHG